jgi:hypothetical protein
MAASSRATRSKKCKERELDPVPTQSKILPDSGDSRERFCLIEGDSSVFAVTVPGDCLILELKDFIHQEAINGTNRAVAAKDLVLFKVRSVPHS